MPYSPYRRYSSNPYKSLISERRATIYQPSTYYVQLLNTISATALRVLVTLAAHRLPDTDMYYITRIDMIKLLPRQKPEINRGFIELYKNDLIQKAGKLDHYYINPNVFSSVQLLFG